MDISASILGIATFTFLACIFVFYTVVVIGTWMLLFDSVKEKDKTGIALGLFLALFFTSSWIIMVTLPFLPHGK